MGGGCGGFVAFEEESSKRAERSGEDHRSGGSPLEGGGLAFETWFEFEIEIQNCGPQCSL